MKQTRIPRQDGIRGCAVLLVLLWHYIPSQTHKTQAKTVQDRIAASLSLTHSGVNLFFVLSGFLITGILVDNRAASNYFRVFYARRHAIIYPHF